MRRPREIREAIEALNILARSSKDDPNKRESLERIGEVLCWVLRHEKRGKGFGDFIAKTLAQVDQAQAANREGS